MLTFSKDLSMMLFFEHSGDKMQNKFSVYRLSPPSTSFSNSNVLGFCQKVAHQNSGLSPSSCCVREYLVGETQSEKHEVCIQDWNHPSFRAFNQYSYHLTIITSNNISLVLPKGVSINNWNSTACFKGNMQ